MLDRIQEHLEAIYGIRCEHRASDFLVDPESARVLGGSGGAREELLVHQPDEDALELALYFEPALLERLGELPPQRALEVDLGGFLQLAEGVSHFVYLLHTAHLSRTVSLLELEAQAEVDKFVICALLGWARRGRDATAALIEALFDRVRLRDSLSDAERWRYAQSSRIARAYCIRLVRLVTAGDLARLLGELRQAYRLGAEAKLQYYARQ
jgi:hypothetical protein